MSVPAIKVVKPWRRWKPCCDGVSSPKSPVTIVAHYEIPLNSLISTKCIRDDGFIVQSFGHHSTHITSTLQMSVPTLFVNLVSRHYLCLVESKLITAVRRLRQTDRHDMRDINISENKLLYWYVLDWISSIWCWTNARSIRSNDPIMTVVMYWRF